MKRQEEDYNIGCDWLMWVEAAVILALGLAIWFINL